jgi:hypothetical protein
VYLTTLPFQQRMRTAARYAVLSSASGVRSPPGFGTSHLAWKAADRSTKRNASSPSSRMGSASPGPRMATWRAPRAPSTGRATGAGPPGRSLSRSGSVA